MTTAVQLQTILQGYGTYKGKIDGQFGSASQAALVATLKAGPDLVLSHNDVVSAAVALNVPVAAIQAVHQVEAAGVGFLSGLPKILPERHIFSALTQHRYDESHPDLSYPKWKPGNYPVSATERYELLGKMAGLDVDAALEACSYGAFQILGENHGLCGYGDVWDFVYDQSLTERKQLDGFVCFLRAKGLDVALRRLDFVAFAKGYNGTAFALNHYDVKLEEAFIANGGVLG